MKYSRTLIFKQRVLV